MADWTIQSEEARRERRRRKKEKRKKKKERRERRARRKEGSSRVGDEDEDWFGGRKRICDNFWLFFIILNAETS